jgi:hypothetical protein
MMASLFIITLLWNLLAPSPLQIAINPETKECGLYWAGDEYFDYHLSPPWEIIDYGTPVQIETGVYKWEGSMSDSGIEIFCNQIGYTYVSGNLGEERGIYSWTIFAYIVFVYKFAPQIIVLIAALIALFLFLRWANKRSSSSSIS